MAKSNINKFLDIELEKLYKHKIELEIAFNSLNRDFNKFQLTNKLLNEEINKLNKQLLFLKSTTSVVSIVDFKKIQNSIIDLETQIEYNQKQISSIEGFLSITITDLENCNTSITKILKVKNHEATVFNFPSTK